MKKEVSWYRITFEVTWEDDSTEIVEEHCENDADRMRHRGQKVYVRKFDGVDSRKVRYLPPWKRGFKIKTDLEFSMERTLNFDKIKSIDFVESEQVVEVVRI